MQITQIKNTPEVIYPDLSFEIVGAAFVVSNRLGWGMGEKYYQRALAEEFVSRKIPFRREAFIPLSYGGKKLGSYFADFIVDGKILLELKVVHRLGYTHSKQVLEYLKKANVRLGILLYFTRDGVKYRRILNPSFSD
ncbi:GxxExxY protein [Candidatus Wolfebacteria bacterium]|nr:GxxExxY protein [Candidatus Wolfebacteria bacterium]